LEAIDLYIITGQTASGKSAVAHELAKRTNTEIISVDSMKIYRGMDIGTAKPSPEVRSEVRYHLIDVVAPGEDFSVAKFVELADAAIADVHSRALPVLLEGGTPLYLKVLTEGMFSGPARDPALRAMLKERAALEGPDVLHTELAQVDPAAASRIGEHDTRRIIRALEVYHKSGKTISEMQTQFGGRRPEYRRHIVALRREREELRKRIELRIEWMFEQGLVEEVKTAAQPLHIKVLAAPQKPLGRTASQAIGYLEAGRLIAGELTLEEAKEEMRRRTWQLARRQMTWLKSFPDIKFYDVAPGEEARETAAAVGRILGLTEQRI
jgi:tRNA dimethylallyltransferase